MMPTGRVLVTGANGFVGTAVCSGLEARAYDVVRATRFSSPSSIGVGDVGPETDWSCLLPGVDCVVHLAAHVHRRDHAENEALEFERVNVAGTHRLARQAAEAGVRRFVFLSTVGVVGVSQRNIVNEDTRSAPATSYARSKFEGEKGLIALSERTGLSVALLRVPLVYGQGAPGNLKRLQPLVERGIPIPFGSVNNQRSAISVENLASAIRTTIDSECVASKVYYVEDGTLWSLREMIEQIASTIGRQPRLVPFPVSMLALMLKGVGKSVLTDRLLGSLVVDSSVFRRETGWVPPLSPEAALARGVV